MTTMFEIRSNWTGFTGAPGYTNMYFEHADPPSTSSQAAADNVRAFWFASRTALPNAVHINVDPAVRLIEDTDGSVVDILAVTPGADVQGSSGAAYSAVSGYLINWRTATVHGGRIVRGRTFLVPGAGDQYNVTGGVLSTLLTTLNTAAAALLSATGPTFGVWSRPREASAGPPVVTARTGLFCEATASSASTHVTELRSRRD